jgi:hypothetical protein
LWQPNSREAINRIINKIQMLVEAAFVNKKLCSTVWISHEPTSLLAMMMKVGG